MDLNSILDQLRQQRDHVDESIAALERIATGMGRRRGRPPKWMTEAAATATPAPAKKRGRPKKTS
jgi:ABC-type transporter Mla subunit MlaD